MHVAVLDNDARLMGPGKHSGVLIFRELRRQIEGEKPV